MAGSLSTYWKKRNFGVTSEPRGEVTPRTGKRLQFVVQKHAASHLHYDFRLEIAGTMVSWAVPKGPSLDPTVRRMAVHVEDHPISYNKFEGVIPAGQYGAGTVEIWDRGTWEPMDDPADALRKGKLKFDLQGEKLRGRWNLVRIRNAKDERHEPWLLIKERDDEARSAAEYDIIEELPESVAAKPMTKAKAAKAKRKTKASANLPAQGVAARLPLSFSPQLATLVDEAPTGDGWIYELKYDGYRIVTRIDGDDIRLFTRNGNNWTSRMTGLRDEIAKLGIESGWLDGEIVVLNTKGQSDFQALQGAFDQSKTKGIAYFVFDLPYFGGYDLRRVPCVDRRALLRSVLEGRESEHVRFSEHLEGDGAKLLDGACRKGLEGLVGKRADSIYVSKRSPAWIKLKCTRRQEFVIVGYTDPKGSRTGFGSLLLAVHDSSGKLRYAGNVGTGFDDNTLHVLGQKLAELDAPQSPFEVAPKGVKGHWVKPKLVGEVAFSEWTSEGRVRHPVFHGLRSDKSPARITQEKAVPPMKGKKGDVGEVGGVKVSHADRVIDKSSGATKIDLVRYYDSIAERMLAHLKGRPAALVRAPAGIDGELFFQKHRPGQDEDVQINTRRELLEAAQWNVVEFHTWNSIAKSIEKPDRMIFDLDPGKGVGWDTIVEGTGVLKKFLDMLELESFLKTSGGKGLHVVVPLAPRLDYAEVKDFTQAVVVHLAATLPKLFVAKSGAQNRVGRIFIDYLRNGRGATTAAAFSARARPGLGVSVPLAWREAAKLESSDQWNIFNVHERLARQRDDPWKDYWTTKQSISAARKRLR